MIPGCGTLKPGAFKNYQTAVREMQSGMNTLMDLDYSWTRQGLVDRYAANPQLRFSELIIETGEGYGWSIPTTNLFFLVKQAGDLIDQLNEVFLQYAELLTRLASSESFSERTFADLSADLNRNARQAYQGISALLQTPNEGVSAEERRALAVFSLAAGELSRFVFENRRRELLRKTIEQNQDTVETFAGKGLDLIRVMTPTFKKYYQDRADFLRERWNASRGSTAPVEDLLELNDHLTDILKMLAEMERSYKVLPRAHKDLLKNLDRQEHPNLGLSELVHSSRRLHQLYQRLSKKS